MFYSLLSWKKWWVCSLNFRRHGKAGKTESEQESWGHRLYNFKRRIHHQRKVTVAVLSLSHVWLLLDCSLSGSSVYGILQARMLEWVAIPFSRGSSQPRDWTWVSCIAGRFWATGEAQWYSILWFHTGFWSFLTISPIPTPSGHPSIHSAISLMPYDNVIVVYSLTTFGGYSWFSFSLRWEKLPKLSRPLPLIATHQPLCQSRVPSIIKGEEKK